MEEVFRIVGFSLGASVGVGAVRGLGEGVRPWLRNALKAGFRVWDVAANASAAARREVAAAANEASSSSKPRHRRRRTEPQKIAIARG